MTNIDRRGVANVLARIKTYHAPQDVGESVITSWVDAFAYAGVTNAADAEASVIRHYTTPGTNQWITPGDVVGHYRAIRNARLEGVDHGDLTLDVDPDDTAAYLAALRFRLRAVGDGMSVEDAKRLPLPPAAAHAALDPVSRERRLRAITGSMR